VVDSLKVLDPNRPIREADKPSRAKIHRYLLWSDFVEKAGV
jgi:hypothetical protein